MVEIFWRILWDCTTFWGILKDFFFYSWGILKDREGFSGILHPFNGFSRIFLGSLMGFSGFLRNLKHFNGILEGFFRILEGFGSFFERLQLFNGIFEGSFGMPRGFQHFGLILAGCSGFSVTAEGSLRIVRWQLNNWMTKTWIMEVKAAFTTWTLTFAVSGQFGSSWGHQNFWQLICIWKWVAKNWPNDVVVALLFRLAASQLRSCQSLNGNPGGIVAMVWRWPRILQRSLRSFESWREATKNPSKSRKILLNGPESRRIPKQSHGTLWNGQESRKDPSKSLENPWKSARIPKQIPQNPSKMLSNL